VLEKGKNGLPVTRDNTNEGTGRHYNPKIPQKDFRACNGLAVRFIHHEGITLHHRTSYFLHTTLKN
jgi:hypothetical protein